MKKTVFILMAIMAFPLTAYSKDVSLVTDGKEVIIYGMSSEELRNIKYQPADKASVNDIVGGLIGTLHQAGYLAAEGFVISDNEIFLNQGAITVVHVFGLSGKAESAVKEIAQKLVGTRPNLEDLDETLAHINALSGVDATFALEASKNRIMDPRGWTPENNTSHYTLIVKASEQAQQYGAVSFDSTPRNFFQRNRVTVTQTFNSVLVGGDHIQGSFTHIRGDGQDDQNEGSLTYFVSTHG